jgi:hypothetical protein
VSIRRKESPDVARSNSGHHITAMCGRVIQSSPPIRYGIVDGMNVRDNRVHNYRPRWNGAPSQDLLVIRRNHKIGEGSLDLMRWALSHIGARTLSGGLLNATYGVEIRPLLVATTHRSPH